MSTTYDFDYLVIGAGSGGIASGNRAAIHGAKVGIIEAKAVGGTCVNLGCVPKKVLWNGATMLEQFHNYAPDYGFKFEFGGIDFAQLCKVREEYISRIHASYHRGFENNKVTIIEGRGKLVDAHTVAVTDAHGNVKHYTGQRILLAPGAYPAIPDVPGAELGIDSDRFFALRELPASAVVIGAGYIAVELAGVLQAFGTQVKLLTRYDAPLRWADQELISHLVKAFSAQGIELVGNTQVQSLAKNSEGKIVVTTNHGEILTDCVIWAVGRNPLTANLGLENTQVQLDEQGFIRTNELNETAEPSIYAIGDATHMPALTPAAIAAGRRLAERLYNNKEGLHFNHKLIPTIIFSHPAIGTIGISEEQARQQFGDYSAENREGIKVYRSTFASMISAVTSHRQTCFMKLVVQGSNEKVIGLHGIGHGVDEMIQGFAVAMSMGATKADFDNTLAIHPTGAEEFVTMR